MATVLYLATFLSFCAIASALDCYECNDCSSFFSYSSRSEKCTEPAFNIGGTFEPRCFKQVESDGTINRGCKANADCISKELLNKCQNGDVGCYTCCSEPNCNSASFLTVSMATLVMSAVFAILRML